MGAMYGLRDLSAPPNRRCNAACAMGGEAASEERGRALAHCPVRPADVSLLAQPASRCCLTGHPFPSVTTSLSLPVVGGQWGRGAAALKVEEPEGSGAS